ERGCRVTIGELETGKGILPGDAGLRARRVRVVEEIENASSGDLARVAERLIEATEPLAQQGLALEPIFAVRLQAIASFVERGAEVDATEHVVEATAFGARVVDIVRDDAGEAHLAWERRGWVAECRSVRVELVGELDVEALAESRAEPGERLACDVEVPRPAG